MKSHILPVIFLSLAVGGVYGQNANPTPATPQDSGNGPGAGGYGQRGVRGGFGGGGMGMGMAGGRGIIGTVTEVTADHFTIKSEDGQTYTVHFSANTRFFKQQAGMRGGGGQGRGGGERQGGGAGAGAGGGMGRGGNPPEQIKPTEIKVGDAIGAMGEVDASGKSVGAVAIAQLDPERAKQMEEMRANYGKTWMMGKVTAIDGVKVTIAGSIDNQPLTFVADENTTFRKRRDPVTLADIQVGDTVRADGAIKDGAFTATAVNVMGMPPGGTPSVPRNAQPQ
jgi:preprotein translocase subunit YajC